MNTDSARKLVPHLVVLCILGVWAWLMNDTGRWPSGDGPHVLGIAERLSLLVREGELGFVGWAAQSLLAPHPPGAYLPYAAVYTLLGTGKGVHLVAVVLLLWLCWDGVRRLGGGWAGGLWLMATPLIWAQAEGAGVDLFTATAAVQSISHLAASDRLAHRRHVWAWAGWMGVGFLSKYTFPMFLVLPCVVAGVWVVMERRWRHLLEALLLFALLAGPWYWVHGHQVLSYVVGSVDADPFLVDMRSAAQGEWWETPNLLWYAAAGVDAWGWAGALALVIGLLGRRREGCPRGAWMLPLLGILGAYAVLTLNPQRQDRYMLPAVPLVAALAGSGRLRAWLAPVAVVGAYGAAAMFLQSGTAPAERRFDHDLVSVGMDWPWPHEAYRPLSLDPGPWRVDETLLQMREAHGRDDGTVGLLLDDLRGAPGMGLFLFRAGALGFRWDLATVMVDFMPGAGGQLRSDVFVGPFATDDWPSREFDVLVAVVRPSDLARASWLRQAGVEEIASWELPGEFEGRLLRIVGP